METIVWFRQDLRVSDNPALFHAAKNGAVIPLYILDDNIENKWNIGKASKIWLYKSLESLQKELENNGLKLIIQKGDPKTIIPKLIKEVQAENIYWNNCYEPYAIKRDNELKSLLKTNVKTFKANLLFEPWEIKNKQGSFFKVYTAFWRHCLSLDAPRLPYPKADLKSYDHKYYGLSLEDLELIPSKHNWPEKLLSHWQIGEGKAADKLYEFLDGSLENYSNGRDIPGISGTSKLSPHLHFGEISPNQIWHATKFHQETLERDDQKLSLTKFLSEIGWREFAHHLLYHFPDFPEKAFIKKFENFPWLKNDEHLLAWQKGQTGYPIVDSGMRELYETGWMHNRVRMIVASFLIKHLLISWTEGEKHFWNTLFDADLANNSVSWQWVAGSGADSAPYFRIFNPITQAERFDKNADYIRKWIPEIAHLSNKEIFKPWESDKKLDYPKPIIDHKFARDRALNSYKKLK